MESIAIKFKLTEEQYNNFISFIRDNDIIRIVNESYDDIYLSSKNGVLKYRHRFDKEEPSKIIWHNNGAKGISKFVHHYCYNIFQDTKDIFMNSSDILGKFHKQRTIYLYESVNLTLDKIYNESSSIPTTITELEKAKMGNFLTINIIIIMNSIPFELLDISLIRRYNEIREILHKLGLKEEDNLVTPYYAL